MDRIVRRSTKMMFYALSVFSLAAFASCVAEELMLPVTTCKRNSADHSACLTRALQESWPQFVAGLPEFDFPPLDPLFIKTMKADFRRNEIYGEVNVFNISCNGLTKIHFSDVRAHFLDDIFRVEIDLQIPKISLDGDCNGVGGIGGLRMGGKGGLNITLRDVRGTWLITGPVVNNTWIIKHFDNSPSVGNMNIHFRNLFGGNKEFNDLVTNFVDEYWPSLYRVMLPTMSKAWESWLIDLVNRLFSKIPFSKVFP